MEIKKLPKADLENYRGLFILSGLLISLVLVLILLGYSVKNVKVENLQGNQDAFVEEEQVPVTERKIELPPPPTQKRQMSDIINVVEDNTELKDEFNFNLEAEEDDATQFENIGEIEEPEEEDNTIYQLTDLSQMPVFPGGEEALRRYIATHIIYPELAKENDIQGKVYVRFVVTKNGTVGKAEVVRGVDPLLDEEALRVVKSLPKFKPGMQGGHPVNVWYIVPIEFRLE